MAYRLASTRNPLGWRPYNFMLSYYEQAKFYVPTATPVGLGTFPNFASARPGPWLVRDNRTSPVPRIYLPAELVAGPPLLGWLSPLVRTRANQNTYTYRENSRTGKLQLYKQDIFPRGVWAQNVFQQPAGMGAFNPRKRYLNGLGIDDPSLPPWLGPIPGVPNLPPLPDLSTMSPKVTVISPGGPSAGFVQTGGNLPTIVYSPAQGPPSSDAVSVWLNQQSVRGVPNKYLAGGILALGFVAATTRRKS